MLPGRHASFVPCFSPPYFHFQDWEQFTNIRLRLIPVAIRQSARVCVVRLDFPCFRSIWFCLLTSYQRLLPAPFVHNPRIDWLIEQFWHYFRTTWLNPAELHLWNHCSNDGPRTNNAVEGWHSSLKHKFSCPHIHLAKFLSELQLMFDEVDVRLAELLRGEPPKARCLTYITNDASIELAKQHFANFLNMYQAVPLPPDSPMQTPG